MKLGKLYDEYKRLVLGNFNIKQIEQLMFLYNFLNKKNQLFRYEAFLLEINNKYSARYLEQLIKCITHNIPYKLFLNNNLSISSLNELRRYLEDSIKGDDLAGDENKLFYHMGEVMIKERWNSNLVYQFRRFIKCYKPISSIEACELMKFISSNKMYDWVILNILYDLYMSTSFVILKEFIDSDYLKKWIGRYNVNNINDRYLLLIELMEYIDKIVEEGL